MAIKEVMSADKDSLDLHFRDE